jgi:hypothetical protein
MKVRPAFVTIEVSGSEPEKTPHTPRGRAPGTRARRGAKLARPIASYPYFAEPTRKPAAAPSWPFASMPPLASPKPKNVVQIRAPEPDWEPTVRPPARALGGEVEFRAGANLPLKAPPIQVPPPAGHTEPPPAPVASQPQLESLSLLQSVTAALDERTSRARIVERLWEDPIREELEVNLGATTESNLYVGVDQRVANGGVFVATYRDLPPGTQASLHITLAGGIATSAHGRVTLKRESLEAFGDPAPGLCVAFELLSNEALALLERFASIRTPWLIEDE